MLNSLLQVCWILEQCISCYEIIMFRKHLGVSLRQECKILMNFPTVNAKRGTSIYWLYLRGNNIFWYCKMPYPFIFNFWSLDGQP